MALQEVTECDEDLLESFGDSFEKRGEDTDYVNEKWESPPGCGYCEMDSDEDEDEYEHDYLDTPDDDYTTCNICDQTGEENKKKRGIKNDPCVDYFQILSKQIFLGMVSMQYQPLIDMVIQYHMSKV